MNPHIQMSGNDKDHIVTNTLATVWRPKRCRNEVVGKEGGGLSSYTYMSPVLPHLLNDGTIKILSTWVEQASKLVVSSRWQRQYYIRRVPQVQSYYVCIYVLNHSSAQGGSTVFIIFFFHGTVVIKYRGRGMLLLLRYFVWWEDICLQFREDQSFALQKNTTS